MLYIRYEGLFEHDYPIEIIAKTYVLPCCRNLFRFCDTLRIAKVMKRIPQREPEQKSNIGIHR